MQDGKGGGGGRGQRTMCPKHNPKSTSLSLVVGSCIAYFALHTFLAFCGRPDSGGVTLSSSLLFHIEDVNTTMLGNILYFGVIAGCSFYISTYFAS